MIDGLVALGSGLLGLVVGLVAALAFRFSERERLAAPEPEAAELDEGTTAVLALLSQATVVARTDGTVVRASAAAHSYGLLRGDRPAHEAVRRMLAGVARDGEIRDEELELPRGPLGNGTVTLQVRVAPLGTAHVLLLAEDRTEARRVEAVRRDFVVNVSHELKTPVGALSLLAETVGEAAEDPEAVRRFATRIQTESTRLSRLVQEIIELSRLQVSDPLGQVKVVRIADVITEAVDRVKTPAAARDMVVDAAPSGEESVWGDRDLLVNAVRNLLDNAVSYSDPGTRIAVTTEVRTEERIVEIAVVDQGMGVPADLQPRLFERFYRVDPARSRDTGGTGLGLSIVKHIVADHGGEVTVWSEPGQGSTFTIRLPLAGPTVGDLRPRVTPPPA